MGPLLRMLTWTAIVVVPGGLLLLPVVLADHLAKKRARAVADAQPAVTSVES